MSKHYRILLTSRGRLEHVNGELKTVERTFLKPHDVYKQNPLDVLFGVGDTSNLTLQPTVPTTVQRRKIFVGDAVSIKLSSAERPTGLLVANLEKYLTAPPNSLPTDYDEIVFKITSSEEHPVGGYLYFKKDGKFIPYNALRYYREESSMGSERLKMPREKFISNWAILGPIFNHPNLEVIFNCTSEEWYELSNQIID